MPPGYTHRLPGEMLDLVLAEHAKLTFSISDLANLRLLCRAFAEDLRPDVIGTKTLYIYLDEQGINDVEALSRFMPNLLRSVTKMAIGTRRVAHYPLILVRTARITHPSETLHDENQSVANFARVLLNTMQRPGFRWSPVEQIITQSDHLYKFAKNDGLLEGCEMFSRDTNFMASDTLIRRFVQLLPRFGTLNTISSNETVHHTRVIVKNSRGQSVVVFTVLNRDRSIPRSNKELWCDNCERDKYRVKCDPFRTMNSFFFQDLGRINNHLPQGTTLFSQLTTLDLNFKNHKGSQHVNTFSQQNLVAFIRRCVGLERFRLATREHEVNGRYAANPIRWVLAQLHHHQWRPKLLHL